VDEGPFTLLMTSNQSLQIIPIIFIVLSQRLQKGLYAKVVSSGAIPDVEAVLPEPRYHNTNKH
jgi:hypothetical protein